MINEPVLKCPKCGTDDFLYTQPSKHFTYIECIKDLGGCGFQYTLPNDDGSNKIKDNLLQQQLDEPMDRLFAGYFGLQEEGESKLSWVLVGLVSELKKDELEKHLKEKVELYGKLKHVKQVQYMIKEYASTNGAFVSEPIKKKEPEPEVNPQTGEIKDIMAIRHKVQPQSEMEISEELIQKHGKIKNIRCASCRSSKLSYGLQGKEDFDLTSDAMMKMFEAAKKKEKFEWEVISCYGCEDQCDLLDIEFTDGTKVKVGWEDYPKLFGVKNTKTGMDDLFEALSKAQKGGTKIIGV